METVLFLVTAGFVAYVLLLYPLVQAWWPQRRSWTTPKPVTPRRVSVIVAVHNGEVWIRAKLKSILESDYPLDCLQVIVVSDGSTDRTVEFTRRFAGRGVQVIAVPRGGKARALNAAIPRATGDILVLTDVRQRLDRDCLKHLVARLEDPSVGAVSAELVTKGIESREEANVGLYWRFDIWIRKKQSARHSTFGANGPCYALRRELAVPLPEDCLLDDVYLPLAGYFQGYRIVLEEQAKVFEFPTSVAMEFRRKQRTLGGLYQILRWYPRLLWPGHPMWLDFLSHKFFRLLLPHALLANLAAAWFLPAPWAAAALLCHGTLYAMAAVDCCLPEQWFLKRMVSPARVFVVMMAAAFCAQSIFFVEPRKLWKVTTARLPAEPA